MDSSSQDFSNYIQFDWFLGRPHFSIFYNDIVMTSFLVTWFSNLHILWNLPKVISLQSFSDVDCHGQVLQRDYDVTLHFWDSKFPYSVKLDISYQPAKFQIPQLSESNFTKVLKRNPQNNYDVTSQYLVFKIAHSVGPNRRHQPAKFHLPRLSASNFTRAGGKHPLRLTRSQKPSPYRVKQYNLSQAAMKIRHVLFILNEINKWNVKLS